MSKPQTLVNLVEGGLAAEMVLARPPRLVRALLYLMVLCLLAAVAWSHFSRIDTYILANGVVKASGGPELAAELERTGYVAWVDPEPQTATPHEIDPVADPFA